MLIDPISAKLQLDIVTLIKFIRDRHAMCHTNINKATDQRVFLDTLKNIDFYDDLKPVALQMINQLDQVPLKRMK